MFDIRDMSAHYGPKRALAWTTMKIYRNLVTAVIGPSGCGKSTFIRSLNRMNDSVAGFRLEGQILYHGHDVYARATNRVEVRRRIGMVFQKPNPFPKSIYDNVAWAPRNLGLKADLDERVERALRSAALWDEVKDRLKASALSLSGGQQQRLCIARAVAVEPDVLLLDEPASALDPVATASIEELMHNLKHRYTIVIVTHNMQQAARVADRTAFFSPGFAGAGGHADRVRRHRDDLLQPGGPAHAGLRHGAVRLGSLRTLPWTADDRLRGDLRQQRLAALPAIRGPGAVRRPAGRAHAGGARLLQAQDPLDLAQLSVGILQRRGALDDHVDSDLVSNHHLVDQAAQIPLQLGDARGQLVASPPKVEGSFVGELALRGQRRRRAGRRAPADSLREALRTAAIVTDRRTSRRTYRPCCSPARDRSGRR